MSMHEINDILQQAQQLVPKDQAELIARLAVSAQQNGETSSRGEIPPVGDATDLAADFWPADENLDELTTAIERLRHESRPRTPA